MVVFRPQASTAMPRELAIRTVLSGMLEEIESLRTSECR
jgi:hypothetical protein